MKRRVITSLFSLSLLCALSANAQAAWWKPALVCDDGAAVVSIDLGERRNVQLVIRNADIIRYFNESRSLTGTSWLVWDGRLHNLTNNANVTMVPGELRKGVFASNQFRGFTSPVSYADRRFYVYREGRGLKVTIVVPAHWGYCNGGFDSGGGCMDPVPPRPEREVANWYFRECKEIDLPR